MKRHYLLRIDVWVDDRENPVTLEELVAAAERDHDPSFGGSDVGIVRVSVVGQELEKED